VTAVPAGVQPIWTLAIGPSHYPGMPLHPPGFIEPCLPTVSRIVPTGPQWAFEIKHDGFRFTLSVANGEKRTNDEAAPTTMTQLRHGRLKNFAAQKHCSFLR
jgi:hypothetical protein